MVDQPLGVDLLQPVGGEGRTGAVAQQAFQTLPVVGLDAHAGVEGEPAAVVPRLHLLAIFLIEQPASHERPQDAAADLGLHRLGIIRVQFFHLDESDALFLIGLENAVDEDDMEMRVFVE